ncbi:hypothetical protein EV143_107136 [Flavobacterium chryseum]|uniref:hypothetical protein n=1 Tax=Flavobacterium sp. P3160 TaxID=2512113 RepID=UPI0010615EE4|nr:hypothetical protein [Flavobacterium sp. P3160]TDO72830.1 hypothetical protein EV143_107136 [Flavobacterium sp. P3160]
MKSQLIFVILLFCSCTNNRFYGRVYDFDTERPIKNVNINISGDVTQTDSTGYFSMKVKSNLPCTIFLQKAGYASKKICRKPDSLGEFSKKSLRNNSIYLIKKESEFSNQIKSE